MKLRFRGNHALPVDEMRRRVEARVAFYVSRYPHIPIATMYRWCDTHTAIATYRGAEGLVRLGEDAVAVELDIPFFAVPFRARIEDFVQRELDAVING